MKQYTTLREAADDSYGSVKFAKPLGHAVCNRTSYKGLTFVDRHLIDDPDFNKEKYMKEAAEKSVKSAKRLKRS